MTTKTSRTEYPDAPRFARRAEVFHVEPTGAEPCPRCDGGRLVLIWRAPDREAVAGGNGRAVILRTEDYACSGCGRELRRQSGLTLTEARR